MAGVSLSLPGRPLPRLSLQWSLLCVVLALLVGALPLQRAHLAGVAEVPVPGLGAGAPLLLELGPRLAAGVGAAAVRPLLAPPAAALAAPRAPTPASALAASAPADRPGRTRRFLLWGALRLEGG